MRCRFLCVLPLFPLLFPGSLFALSITWTGTNGSTWDNNTTINWNNAGTPEKFVTLDDVIFDDTSANGTVNLSGSLQPGSVTVNNGSTAYTFGGSGQFGGSTSLLKSGTGTLTISTRTASRAAP